MSAPFLTPLVRARRQRGAALLTAMIIVTLVATLASAMVWQQWRAVQVESAERARAQAAWILSGALDFARLILREDQKSNRPTALSEPWATPLAEARLSTFLAADASNADDGPEAFLSGSIEDAQSRYNLANILNDKYQVQPNELARLGRLCQTAGIDASVAQRIANGLSQAHLATQDATSTSTGAPLLPKSVSQLTWLGIDPASIQALRPYVELLDFATPLNVNTASREVLAAVVDNLDLASAERLVQMRTAAPFQSADDFRKQLGSSPTLSASLGVKSEYFEVHGRLRLADRILVQNSLVRRDPSGSVVVLWSERVSSVETSSGHPSGS